MPGNASTSRGRCRRSTATSRGRRTRSDWSAAISTRKCAGLASAAHASRGSGVFSTDPAELVPEVDDDRGSTSGTNSAGSVEKTPDPFPQLLFEDLVVAESFQ